MPWMLIFPLIFLSSFILTMVGLGGGLVFTPLLVLLDYSVQTAVTTSLFLNGVAAVSASWHYYRERMVDFSIALPLIVTSSLAAPLGALTTGYIEVRVFTWTLAGIMIIAALRMFFAGRPAEAVGDVGSLRRRIGGGGCMPVSRRRGGRQPQTHEADAPQAATLAGDIPPI